VRRNRKAKRISIALRRAWADPEKRVNLNTWSNPSVRRRRIEGIKRARHDPERRPLWIQHLRDACKRPLTKKRRSLAQQKRWKDPKNREQLSAALRRAWADPEKRESWEAGNKRANSSPEKRAAHSAATKAFWANLANRHQRIRAIRQAANDPERRQRKSEALKKVWAERSAKLTEGEILEGLKSKPLKWRLIVPLLRIDQDLGNVEVQDLAGIKPSERLSRSSMNRLRIFAEVRGPQGRPARRK
jgi:hypothetical protein